MRLHDSSTMRNGKSESPNARFVFQVHDALSQRKMSKSLQILKVEQWYAFFWVIASDSLGTDVTLGDRGNP